MNKQKRVFYFSTLILALAFCAETALAQAESDILLFEDMPEKVGTQKPKDTPKKETAKNTKSDKKGKTDGESESWLKSLITKGTNEIFGTYDEESIKEEKKRISQILESKKSNAANFDISGAKLRMNPKEAEEIMSRNGYRKIVENMEIPNFIKWRSEELCRQHGVIGVERLNACTTQIAKENGYQFVIKQIYNRYSTKETIEINYTSTFTNNLSYQVSYKSSVPLSVGRSSKSIYLNNIKIFDFWQRIDMKYGKPDNETEVKWGLGGKKPYLKASTGTLLLVDPLLKDLDAARMFNEDTRFANTQYYNF